MRRLSFDHEIPNVDILTCHPQPHKQFRLSLRSTDWKTTNKTFSEKCGTIEAEIEGQGDWFF